MLSTVSKTFQVVDMVARTEGNPFLFTPPPPNAIDKLWLGANVQLLFESLPPEGIQGEEPVTEKLWVTITNLTNKEMIKGILNLDATVIPNLKSRTLIEFTPNSILDIDFWDAV